MTSTNSARSCASSGRSVLAAALARAQARGELPVRLAGLAAEPDEGLVDWLERLGSWDARTGAHEVVAAVDAFGHGYGVGMTGPEGERDSS